MKSKGWSKESLIQAAKISTSIRQLLHKLNLREAGGNYAQIKKYLKLYQIDTSHFRGQGWNKGLTGFSKPLLSLEQILVTESSFQSHKLKRRLFAAGLKSPSCEECGWSKRSEDGRIPLELDHINGHSRDNRLENLRILCPNCHSLKPTHRGRNIGRVGQVVEWQTRST